MTGLSDEDKMTGLSDEETRIEIQRAAAHIRALASQQTAHFDAVTDILTAIMSVDALSRDTVSFSDTSRYKEALAALHTARDLLRFTPEVIDEWPYRAQEREKRG